MTSTEIAKASHNKLSVTKVKRLSKLESWATVEVGDRDEFMLACGLDPVSLRRPVAYIRRALRLAGGFKHIVNLGRRQRLFYLRLMEGK